MTYNQPQQNYDCEYQLVPVDEEQKRADALVGWVLEVLERSGNLSTRSRQMLLSRLRAMQATLIWRKMEMVYLECKDYDQNKHRFYRMTVQRSLFGNLILTRSWGRIGSRRPRELHQEFNDPEELMREIRRILATRQRHGYQMIRDGRAHD